MKNNKELEKIIRDILATTPVVVLGQVWSKTERK